MRRQLLLRSLSWFLLGPLVLLLSLGVRDRLPFFVFLIFAQLWAYWHVVRQHYGFMVLYQKKNGEVAGKENQLDYYSFYILMLAPFLSFILRHPTAREEFGLSRIPGTTETGILFLIHSVIAVNLIFYFIRTCFTRRVNLPKNLFLAACVPLHLLIFLHPYISTRVDLRMFAVFVTFYHNIQYHGIVWFYNRNRYGADDGGRRFGLASLVSRNFLTYYICGILFTILYRYSNWFFAGSNVPFGLGPNSVSRLSIGGLFTVSDLAIGFWWGFAFNHYYLDQNIWRVSKDKQLNSDLRLAAASAV